MTAGKTMSAPEMKNLAAKAGKLEPIFSRIDLIAILTVLLGVSFFGLATVVFAFIQFFRLISIVWSYPSERWFLIAPVIALVWVIARWKKY